MASQPQSDEIRLKDRPIFPEPPIQLAEVRIFDVPELSDVASPVHSKISKFLPGARPAAPSCEGRREPIELAEGLAARVRARVSSVIGAEIAREYASGKGVGIGSAALQGQVALGMVRAMADVRKGLPQGGSVSVSRGEALERAGEVAASLARRSFAAAGNALVAARARLAPIAKFADARIVAAGDADRGLLQRAARPLAMLAAGAGVTFLLMGGADAQSQTRSRMQATQSQSDASWLAASGISAILPDLPNMDAPAPARPSVRSVAPIQAVPSAPPPKQGTLAKPSTGFKEIATMVATTNLEDIEQGNRVMIRMEEQEKACLSTWRPGAMCKFESSGISVDFVNGTFTATLAPMRGVSDAHRLVAVENSHGLRIHDGQALADVRLFTESRYVEMGRRMGADFGEEVEEEEDVVTPKLR